jgi:hypothetical protein
LSDEQILAWYDHEHDERGSLVFSKPPGPKVTPRRAHVARCIELGITEPEDIERLWAEAQAKREAAAAKQKGKKKRRRS